MDSADAIATAITAAVSACTAGSITVEQCSEQTKALWDRARNLSIANEVDRILQGQSLAQMAEAMERMNIRPISTELERCNYCQVKAIERFAATRGQIVTVLAGPLGVAVHAHREGEQTSDRNWTAWFNDQLPDHCTCEREP